MSDLSSLTGGVFQMEILNYFRTGNPLADALIFSVLTYFVTTVMDSYYGTTQNLLAKFRAFFKSSQDIEFVIESMQPSVSVERYDGDDKVKKEPNKLYHAVAWFINDKKCVIGDANSYKVVTIDQSRLNAYGERSYDDDMDEEVRGDECIFIPTSDIKIAWNDNIINGTHNSVTDRQGDEKGSRIILRMHTKVSTDLEKFCKIVLTEFEAHERKRKLGQRIYTLSDNGGYNGKVMWSAKPFHPKTEISAVILRNNMQREIQEDIEKFLSSKDVYTKNGMLWKRGYLFYGRPGTGKTSLVKAIAARSQFDVYTVKLARFHTDMDMETNLRKIPPKSIVLFEDIDCMTDIAHSRKKSDTDSTTSAEMVEPMEQETGEKKKNISEDDNLTENTESDDDEEEEDSGVRVIRPSGPSPQSKVVKKKGQKPTLNTLLNFLDGVDSPEGIIPIMTTNHVEKLDEALLRDGRIDAKYHLEYCSKAQIIDLSFKFFKERMNMEDLTNIPDNSLSPATVSRIMMDVAFYGRENPFGDVIRMLERELEDKSN